MNIDFGAVRSIPIEMILPHYGVSEVRRSKSYITANCPLPSHTSKESPWSFKVSLEKNLWTCHSASCRRNGKAGGDVIDLICLLENLKPLEAAKKLSGLVGVSAITSKKETVNKSSINKPLGFTLSANPEHPMIQDRKISIETARSYGVGYYRSKKGTASMDDRIIFPLHESGELVGYIGRTILPVTPENPKWKMGKGIVKNMIFGLERCDTQQLVVIVESPWAVLYLREQGIQAASILGKELTEGQEKAIAPFRMLSLALDNDDAGREATEKIAERLRATHAVKRSYFRE